jgi:glycosyltransferase involved in cell wall biosynthesis
MRVLLIISDLRGGGAQRVTITLARGLAGRGHEVHIVLFQRRIDYEVPDNVALHALAADERMRSGWLGKRILAWRLRQWSRAAGHFDLTVSSLPFTSEVVDLARLPSVWHHIHNSLSSEIRGLRPEKARRRRRRYRRVFDGRRLIAVSGGVADDLRSNLGLARAQIVVCYNPFDLGEIRRLASAPEPELPLRPYVVHAGRFARQKRHDILFDAYAASGIPHDLVLLTQDDPGLRQLIRARGLESRVTVAGFRANPFPWYAHASALVLSSDHEGFGNVLVEALACGTPVVSTDCPSGPNEILVGPLARYLSPCGDVGALARNLRDIIDSPPEIPEKVLDRFALSAILDNIEALPSKRLR